MFTGSFRVSARGIPCVARFQRSRLRWCCYGLQVSAETTRPGRTRCPACHVPQQLFLAEEKRDLRSRYRLSCVLTCESGVWRESPRGLVGLYFVKLLAPNQTMHSCIHIFGTDTVSSASLVRNCSFTRLSTKFSEYLSCCILRTPLASRAE